MSKYKKFKTKPSGRGGWLDWQRSTYTTSDKVSPAPFYKHQRIGKTSFVHPAIYCDLNVSTVDVDFYELTLGVGEAAITSPDFSIDSSGNLIVSRADENKFFIDYYTGTLQFKN